MPMPVTSPQMTAPSDIATPEPDVLFIEDIAKLLRTSRATIERRRRDRSFPIPELPAIDKRARWARRSVEEYLSAGIVTRKRGKL
jgi:hypothetical protein